MTQIKKLTIKGYKSIQSLEDFELRSLNILIGANGAGKSNFIKLFSFLASVAGDNFALDVEKMGGANSIVSFGSKRTQAITVKISFMPDENSDSQLTDWHIALHTTVDDKLASDDTQIRTTTWTTSPTYSTDPAKQILSMAKKFKQAPLDQMKLLRQYHFHDTSDFAPVKMKHAVNDNLRLKPDAANLAAYLRMLQEQHIDEYARIVETIRLVLPFFDDFVHRPGDPEFVELEWLQKGRSDTPLKAHMLSDGSLRFICLVTLLLQPLDLLPDTILIDEPELGLHPYAINILADIFKQVAEDKQLIVSTQSVELINELAPEDVVVVDQEQGVSSFKRLTESELSDWLQDYSLGELWKRNILGGRP